MFGANPETIFHFHSGLLMDGARTDTYHRAIASVVKPGDVVLDLGSGTGILSFLACQAGARRVYAVESGDVAELSRLVVAANGFEDRIVLLHDTSYRITLPEKVDVIVTDTFHTFGLQDGLLGSMIDARQRFLKPGGRIIPRSIQLVVVPVELPDIYRRLEIWSADQHGSRLLPGPGICDEQSVFRSGGARCVEKGIPRRAGVGHSDSAAGRRDRQPVRRSGHAIATRPGVMHGLGGWFVAELDEGVCLSNSPDIMTVSWKNAFFPLDRPVTLAQGDALVLKIETCNGATWRWQVTVNGRTLAERTSFRGFPLSKEAFRQALARVAPMLTPEGDARAVCPRLFNGERTSARWRNFGAATPSLSPHRRPPRPSSGIWRGDARDPAHTSPVR